MELRPRPADYIERQRFSNAVHADGRPENEDDVETAKEVARVVMSFLPDPRSWLDVGCRVGTALRVYGVLLPDADITGVDIVPDFAKWAPNTITADAHELPFEDQSFEVVTCVATWEHCHDLGVAAQEMLRVASRLLYITVDLEDKETFENNPSHFARSAELEEWIDLLRHPEWKLIWTNENHLLLRRGL
jgi:SAM-dependent methyltransferase